MQKPGDDPGGLVRVLRGGEPRVEIGALFRGRFRRRLVLFRLRRLPVRLGLRAWRPGWLQAQSAVHPPTPTRRPERPRSLGWRRERARDAASHNSSARDGPRQKNRRERRLSLPRLVALLRLVDDVDAALATHEAVVAMAVAQGFQRITDFHDITRRSSREGRTHRRIMRRRSYASNQAHDQGRASLRQRRPCFRPTPAAQICEGRTGELFEPSSGGSP